MIMKCSWSQLVECAILDVALILIYRIAAHDLNKKKKKKKNVHAREQYEQLAVLNMIRLKCYVKYNDFLNSFHTTAFITAFLIGGVYYMRPVSTKWAISWEETKADVAH